MRDEQGCIHIGVQMMVYQHLASRTGLQGLLHVLCSRQGVEVETEHQIGYLQHRVHKVLVLVVAHNLLSIRHPLQIVRKLVGNHQYRILTQLVQHFTPPQHRAYGIAVGIGMAAYDDTLCCINEGVQLRALPVCHDIFEHCAF